MKTLQRLTATILALAVVLLTPGLDAYAAAGKSINGEGTPGSIPALGVVAVPGAVQVPDAENLGAASLQTDLKVDASAPVAGSAETNAAGTIEAAAQGAPNAAASADAAAAAQQSAAAGQVSESKVADTKAINRSFRGLGRLFGSKKDAGVATAAGSASGDKGSGLAPAPQGPQDEEAAARAKKTDSAYIQAVNYNQAGYEGLSASSLPIWLQQHFGSMAMMPDLAINGSLASIVGRQMAPLLVNRVKLKTAYLSLIGLTAASAFVLGGLAFLGYMSGPLLFLTMTIFRGFQGAASVAERSVIPAIKGGDQNAIENLRGRKQSWSEVASDLVQNGSTAVSRYMKTADYNMIAAPFLYLAAMYKIATGIHIPAEADAARIEAFKKNNPAGQGGVFAGMATIAKTFVNSVKRGYQVVMHDEELRNSTSITNIFILFNMLVYAMVAPLFGQAAAAMLGADPSIAGPVMGLLAGLFSFGGLFAGQFVNKQSAELAAKHAGDPAALAEAGRVKMIKWLKIGALSLLLMGSTVLALQLPYFAPLIGLIPYAAPIAAVLANPLALAAVIGAGAVISMWKPMLGLGLTMGVVAIAFPLHVVVGAVAFFLFGGLQVVASLKNDSGFDAAVQKKAPADYANAAAFNAAFSSFVGLLGMIVTKFIFYGALPFGIPSPVAAFTGLHGIWPWVALFAGMTIPAAMHWYRTALAQDRLTSPTAKPVSALEKALNIALKPFEWAIAGAAFPFKLVFKGLGKLISSLRGR